GLTTGLDQVVRQLGYDVDARRQVSGSRSQIVKQFVLTLFALVITPLVRFLPDLRDNTLFDNFLPAAWLSGPPSSLMLAGVLVSLLAGAALFPYLEWRANLPGLFRPRPELTSTDEEVRFIVEEVRQRQRRGWLWLCLELPLVFLLVPMLLAGHVALLIARLVRRARGQAPRVAERPQRLLFSFAAGQSLLAA